MKSADREALLEAEQDVQEIEAELWLRSRGKVEFYEEHSEEELEDWLNQAQNHFNYLQSCWESDYGDEEW